MIYLDYNSTTPVDPIVQKSMDPFLNEMYGNAASTTHELGRQSKSAVDGARMAIASCINAKSHEVVFTSGATESLNLGIMGTAIASTKKTKKIITTPIEHKAVLDSCKFVKKFGVDTVFIDVDSNGFINVNQLSDKLDEDVILVVIQHVNNEVGSIEPIPEIGSLCADAKVPLMVDAAQSLGKLTIDVKKWGVTYLAGSSHKIYGPKGVGIFYRNSANKFELSPIIHGGGHEQGLRSGTLNVPGIVGFGRAIEIAQEQMNDETNRLHSLATSFVEKLTNESIDFLVNGSEDNRVPGNLNICFNGVDADWIILHTPEIAISTGSACTTETIEPSHVLRAMGLADEVSNSSVRISFGRFTTEKEMDKAARLLANSVRTYLARKESILG